MEFKRENPSARFSVPDKITVRQQLQYFSEARSADRPVFERLWVGASLLITDWECEIMPDYKISLDDISDPNVTDVLIWAGLAVMRHIDSLDNISKN